MNDLRVLFCAPEISPYAKTGGLADVADALPQALSRLGCDVRLFMPLYRGVRKKSRALTVVAENIPIALGPRTVHVHLWESRTASSLPIYFLEKDEFFDRSYLYATPTRKDYEDNAERYITFSRAVHLLCARLDWYPSILHLHDWQTGLVAAYHKFHWRSMAPFAASRTVFTIHNLAYQGLFPSTTFGLTQLPADAFTIHGMEFWGHCNFLKAGLAFADFLTTVSPRYSMEIQQPEFGHGLEGVLRERQTNLQGILNGIDTEAWDPENDLSLPATYTADDLSGKAICKAALLRELGWEVPGPAHPGVPLAAMISRIDNQKGFDLLKAILDDIMAIPLHLVILGTGEHRLENELQEMERRNPNRVRVLLQFSEALAHRIEAAADIFLMPSRYEPCGLNQMYSLRYGTIPVVHATGGLDDSVVDVVKSPQTGTGFKFASYEPAVFLAALRAALDHYKDKGRWQMLQQRAMRQDFSWERSAREYVGIYERILTRKRTT